uniref:Uncharacterized protein n=1 Tax=Parascaris univalens TaxID=6257 RepID=A0A914ZU91_PARUN
ENSRRLTSAMRLIIAVAVLLAQARGEERNFTLEVETKANATKTVHCKQYITLDIDEQLEVLSATGYNNQCIEFQTISNENHIKIPYRLKISGEIQLLHCSLLAAESVQTVDGRYLAKYKVRCSVKRRPQHHCLVEYIFVIIFVLATIGTIITVFAYFCRSGSREQIDTSSDRTVESKNNREDSDIEQE